MICPKCGHKMKDDMLYCEKCGEEIQFVPDFEPEIEQSISDTLSEIKIQDLENLEYNTNSNYSDEYNEEYNDEYNDEYGDEFEEVYDEEYSEEYSDEYAEKYEDEYAEEYEDEYAEEYEDEYDDAYTDEYVDEYSDDNIKGNDYDNTSSAGLNEDINDNDNLTDEYYESEDDYSDEEYDDYDDYEDDDDDEFSKDPFEDFDYESEMFRKFIHFIKYSKLKWLILILLLLIIGAAVFGGIKLTNKLKTENSVDYQVNLATEAANNGDYAKAIEYMEKALSLNSKDSGKKYILADYYFANNEDEKALLMLWEIINDNDSNSQAAYKKVITYYTENGDFAMVEKILSNCNDESIKNEFGNYLALAPEFSIPEGTYEDSISIILSGEIGGTIYYTLDGSEPTTESDIYYSPIDLSELGVYTISALYVNAYGIESEIIRKTYTIDISTPKAPNVLLDPGTYDIPMLIEVDVQNYCTVYYTTDGTLPTIFSNQYTGPIAMPIGQTHFIFIAMSQESVWSEVTEVDYNLNISSMVDLNVVSQALLNYDLLQGKSIDLEGHLIGNTTKYFYQISSAIAYTKDKELVLLDHGQEGEEDIPDKDKIKELDKKNIEIYYLIVENLVDNQENTMKTGTFYLCNINSGELYKAIKDENGYFSLGDLITPDQYTINQPTVQEDVTTEE